VARILTATLPLKPEIAGTIPRAIADLEAGDPTVAQMILSGAFPPTIEREIPPTLTESSFAFLDAPTDARLALSLAMRTAVLCNDEADVTLAGIAAEELESAPSPLRGPVPVRSAITLYAQCRALDTGAEALDPAQPSTSIPVLVLGGSYDATTAPSWAEEAADALPNARFVLIPGAGHATARWSPCARDLIDGFIADPASIMDTGCLAADHPPLLLPDDAIPDE
jgi:pimeloyl-ACP methyl ester carboxylesterase